LHAVLTRAEPASCSASRAETEHMGALTSRGGPCGAAQLPLPSASGQTRTGPCAHSGPCFLGSSMFVNRPTDRRTAALYRAASQPCQ
jgi:hypothetical protein